MRLKIINYCFKNLFKSSHFLFKVNLHQDSTTIHPLRNFRSPKSFKPFKEQNFVDGKHVKAVGGGGGDGCVSFLSVWCNEHAGPDGGDGGNGGHVVFVASKNVKDLHHVPTVCKGDDGVNGMNKNCNGKNASHTLIPIPVGTVIKDEEGQIVGDLETDGSMFLAARGGAGGKGNVFFTNDTCQAPDFCEYGGLGENIDYFVELCSIAHAGMVGFPNAGKSTLLRAISRARPKVAPYPFTTLKPHVGMVLYDDYEQIAVADLPGLIEDSHKNKGLGIQFLRHVERCSVLMYVLDMTVEEPWTNLEVLKKELFAYNDNLMQRKQIIIANKIDLLENDFKIEELRKRTDLEVFPLSAKTGENLTRLLKRIRVICENVIEKN